jgi:hypothetical protein
MYERRSIRLLTALTILALAVPAAVHGQEVNLDWKRTDRSKVRQVVTNLGSLLGHRLELGYPGLINTEYPAGSFIEHTGEGGIWVGGVTPDNDTLVTSTLSWAPGPYFWETYPSSAPWDTIWVVNRGETVDIPYWQGYTALSDQDLVMRYNDYGPASQRIDRHEPLFLEFVQTVYTWGSPAGLDEVLVYTYHVTPTEFDIRDAYITFWLDGNIGRIEQGINFLDDFSYYIPELRLAASEDAPGGIDGTAVGPIGIMLMPPADVDNSNLKWSFHWGSEPYAPGMIPPTDSEKYRELMSTGRIMQDQQSPTGAHFTLSFGPVTLRKDETFTFRAAQVHGEGRAGMVQNARLINRLADQDFRMPGPPPVPPMRVEPGDKQVRLIWSPTATNNPETYTDPYRGDDIEQPFEGYRIYKSTVGPNGPWTLLAEYDIPANGYGNDFGLAHEYVEDLLLNNVEYYYSVTAFSKEDRVLNWPSLETAISANARRVIPGTPPPESVGEVAVVPNPYRGDIAYHEYNPAWERPDPSRERWLEQDRRLQFINLPEECEIRIYTVSGELVQTLYHNHPTLGYEDWNMTSSVGQAISSGIYVFTVEDLRDGRVQVGKFVVIK